MENELLLEIRQGIGGNESFFFCKELFRMYLKFFEKKKIFFSILNNSNQKEIILKIKKNFYENFLINESGVHRVQRIPKNENNGRIHTSTCTVFVKKEETENFTFSLKDIKIETCKSSGAGGQHVNTTNSSIKAIHLPTNLFIECSDERSQKMNKEKAISLLINKIKKKNDIKNFKIINDKRKKIISNSERSKKIRTYNFPNNKIINHNNGKIYYEIYKILDGNLDIIFKN